MNKITSFWFLLLNWNSWGCNCSRNNFCWTCDLFLSFSWKIINNVIYASTLLTFVAFFLMSWEGSLWSKLLKLPIFSNTISKSEVSHNNLSATSTERLTYPQTNLLAFSGSIDNNLQYIYPLSTTSGLNDSVALVSRFIINSSQSFGYLRNSLTLEVNTYN